MVLGICIDLFVAYMIFQGKTGFIKLSFWLYVVQILSFDIGDWGFSFIWGFTFHILISIGDALITVNLFAILMAFLLFKAMQSVNKT